MAAQVSSDDSDNLENIVKKSRLAFQDLCKSAAQSVASNPRAGVRPGTPAASRPENPARSRSRSRSRTPAVEANLNRPHGMSLGPHSGLPGAREGTRAGSRSSTPAPAASTSAAEPSSSSAVIVPAASTNLKAKLSKAEQLTQELKRREDQYGRDAKKPNLHIGLHFGTVAEEYGRTANVNVLIGEDKHR